MSSQHPFAEETETNPAFGVATLSRVSSTPGAVLFDSEIRHSEYVALRIHTAERQRGLNRDWIHARETVVEVALSKAQWADLISSFNNGNGVPVTIKYTRDEGESEPLEFAPRLALSQAETRAAADKAFAKIKEAFAVAEDKPTKANMRALRAAIENAPSNVEFAAKSLTEHTEKVVTKARADIEAMIENYIEHRGLEIEGGSAAIMGEIGGSGD